MVIAHSNCMISILDGFLKPDPEWAQAMEKCAYENRWQSYLCNLRWQEKKKKERKMREQIESDSYIKGLLTTGCKLKHADIPQPLVEAKREHMKIRRKLNEINQAT